MNGLFFLYQFIESPLCFCECFLFVCYFNSLKKKKIITLINFFYLNDVIFSDKYIIVLVFNKKQNSLTDLRSLVLLSFICIAIIL